MSRLISTGLLLQHVATPYMFVLENCLPLHHQPDVGLRMLVAAKSGDRAAAEIWYDRAREANCKPDHRTFQALINAAARILDLSFVKTCCFGFCVLIGWWFLVCLGLLQQVLFGNVCFFWAS